MPKSTSRLNLLLERVIPWLVLAFLMTYTYAFFFQVPYSGFDFSSSQGRVIAIFVASTTDSTLHIDDRVIQIGPVSFVDFIANLHQTLFNGVRPGQVVSILIERNGNSLTIPWVLPGPNFSEVLYRLNSEWWLGYVFWLGGTITLFYLDPKDGRWRLLTVFNYLTAGWLVAGALSQKHIWESAVVLRSIIWLSVPVYLHLHFIFPRPLGSISASILQSAYFVGAILFAGQWLGFLPNSAYFLGFLLALVGSLLLLIAHFILDPIQRRDIRLLILAPVVAFFPPIILDGINLFFKALPLPPIANLVAFSSLSFIPVVYLYIAQNQTIEIHQISNNYIIGPALRDQLGRVFVGRDDIYNKVLRLWTNERVKQPVVFYGQRRMGKTSILLHLESGLGSDYLPVFLDLQTLATVERHGTFLYNLADSTAEQLNKAGLTVPIPARADYADEPFVAFRKFIEATEAAIPEGKWAVLMLDEFEMAEEKLRQGVFPPDLMLQFRNIMQHHPRLTLVLAGSHHLDELRQDYWNPLLNLAHVVKVDYLSRAAAEELIINPWPDFPLEFERPAIDEIIAVTGGQPLLLQSICSGVVERVNHRLAHGGPQTLPTATLDDAQAEIQNTLEKSEYFRAVFASLSSKEKPSPQAQALLKALAAIQSGPDAWVDCVRVEAALAGQFDADALITGWETLERRDVIDVEGERRRVTVELMRRWLLLDAKGLA